MKVQIDREAFNKYQQNERDKVIFMHKLIIYFFIIINVICVVFIFLLKSNSLSIQSANKQLSEELADSHSRYQSKEKIISHRQINIYSQLDFQYNLLTEILKSQSEFDLIVEWIKKKPIYTYLCFKSTYYDDSVEEYKNSCRDNYQLFVIELTNRKRFGAFTSQGSVNTKDEYLFHYDNSSFIFSLDTQKVYPIRNPDKAFAYLEKGFARFGEGDLVINPGYLFEATVSMNFPHDYGSEQDDIVEITGGERQFSILRLEVFNFYF